MEKLIKYNTFSVSQTTPRTSRYRVRIIFTDIYKRVRFISENRFFVLNIFFNADLFQKKKKKTNFVLCDFIVLQ